MAQDSAAPPSVASLSASSAGATRVVNRVRARRKLWLDIHLYLGLTVGLVLAITGLTGSLLVFYQDVEEWLNPAFVTASSPADAVMRPLGELMAAAQQAAQPGSRITQLYWPSTGLLVVSAELPSKEAQQIFLDPYRAHVVDLRRHSAHEWVPSAFIDAMFQLHYALFLGENGVTVVAVCALLLLLSLVSGIVVWWPLTSGRRQAFAIRRPTNRVRLTFDLHKTFSIYTVVVVAAVLISGIYMNWYDPFVWVTKLFSPQTRSVADVPHSTVRPGGAPIEAERALAIATAQYPDGMLGAVVMPEDGTGTYQIVRREVPGVSAFWSERAVSVDQYSGEIVLVRDPTTRRSAGETFLDWQWPLHSGQAFGMPGRLLVFASGLACPVIYVTGILMWWRKRKPVKRGA